MLNHLHLFSLLRHIFMNRMTINFSLLYFLCCCLSFSISNDYYCYSLVSLQFLLYFVLTLCFFILFYSLLWYRNSLFDICVELKKNQSKWEHRCRCFTRLGAKLSSYIFGYTHIKNGVKRPFLYVVRIK